MKIDEQIVCAGFGGQGIMLMGKLLAEVGMKEGYEVTWMPSYGAEVRGGTAHSMVHISEKKIASPTVGLPTTCVAMNSPSANKFINKVKKGGLLILNSSMVGHVPKRKDIKEITHPFTQLASELGNTKVANMIAVGVLIRAKKMFTPESVIKCLEETLPLKGEILALNKKAIRLGYEHAGK